MANVYDLIVKLAGDGSKLRDDIDKDIAKIEELQAAVDEITDKIVKINIDDAGAEEKMAALKAELEAIKKEKLSLGIDVSAAEEKLAALSAEFAALHDQVVTVGIEDAELEAGMAGVESELSALDKSTVKLYLDDTDFETGIAVAEAQLSEMHNKTIKVKADTAAAETALAAVVTEEQAVSTAAPKKKTSLLSFLSNLGSTPVQRLPTEGAKPLPTLDELSYIVEEKDITLTVHAAEAEAKLLEVKTQTNALKDIAMEITADDKEANRKLDIFKTEAASLADIAATINVFDADAKKKLGTVTDKADRLRVILGTIDVGVFDSEAKVQIDELKTKLDGLHDKNVVISVEEEQNGTAITGGGKNKGGPLLPTILGALSPILGPVGAAGIGGLGGLLSAITPGMAGGAGFAAVSAANLKPVMTAMTALTAAQNQYNAAVTNAQKLTALKAEQAALAGLDTEQRKALAAAEAFKTGWKGFAKQFEPAVLTAFTNALTGIQQLFKSIAPAIAGFASAFITLQKDASKALTSPFWKSFFRYLGGEAKASTLAFGKGLGNLAHGFAALLMAFNPLAKQMDVGWTNMTASFAKWASHLSATKGFKNFLHDVSIDGPLVLSVIGNIVLVINDLLKGAEPLGRTLLQVVNSILSFTNGLLTAQPWLSKLIVSVIAGIGAFKLLTLAYNAIQAGLVALPALLEDAAAAFDVVKVAIAAIGGPWGILLLAITAGVLYMITHWDTVKKWWADFTRWIGHMWDSVLAPFFKKWGPDLLLLLAPFIGIPLLIWQHWSQISKWFGQMWDKVLLPFFKKWGPDILLILAPFIGIPLMLYHHWSQISKWMGTLWASILRVLNADLKQITSSFALMWKDITKLFTGWIKDAEGFGASIVNGLVGGIERALTTAKQGLATAWHDVTSLFGGSPTSSLSVSSGTASMVHGSNSTVNVVYSGSITHKGSVSVSNLTNKAVQQVNQQLYSSAIRK